MAYRTTAELVRGIIDVDTISVPDLTPFIATANSLVTTICVPAGYTDATLELIERWLAAHFYAVRDPRTTYEAVGGVAEVTESKVDLGLFYTRYGQQAAMLDTAGGLGRLNRAVVKGTGGRGISITWLGKKKDCCDGTS